MELPVPAASFKQSSSALKGCLESNLPKTNKQSSEPTRMRRRKNSRNTDSAPGRAKRTRKYKPRNTQGSPSQPKSAPAPPKPQRPPGPSPSQHPSRNPPPPSTDPKFTYELIRTEVPREFPKSKQANRLFGLEHCPVFYPTIDEFKEPMKYFESIGSKLKSYGIGKIVPPTGWKPPFVLDTEQFKFKTRLQRLNSMEASARANVNFLEQLYLFHKQRGSSGFINPSSKIQVPVIDHRPVDLWRLRKEINELGGYDNITIQRKWSFLAKTMGYNVKASPAISFKLKAAYVKIIAPFDEYFNRFKQSSPTNIATQRDRSPADSLSPLTSSLADHDETNRGTNLKEVTKEDESMMGGPATSAPKLHEPHTGTSKSTLVDTVLEEQCRSFANPTRRPSASRLNTTHDLDVSLDQGGDVCEICGSDEDDSNILLCDSCDKGFHLQCLTPPLLAVPEGDWYCDTCIVSTGNEFGFEEGREHTLASFQRRADAFKKLWIETHPISQKQSRRQSLAKEEDPNEIGEDTEDSGSAWSTKDLKDQLNLEEFIEKEFWRLVESQTETVEIEYGADINSAACGSGFPNIEKHPFDPYARDAWNLNNLPIAPGSLLRFIKSDVAGMTQPWIYVGMVFSTFAWHKEDHYTYSINYHHWGDTKTWYGVPGEDDTKLEEAMKTAAPELFEQQPDLMFQLVTLMSPGRLRRAGVRTYVCDQRPNEFVITCPRSYHSGFNHGFNLNEAVNFCLPDWLPEGYLCVKHYKALHKMPVFSHDELLVTIFTNEKSPKVSRWLLPHFREMVEREVAARQTALAQIANLSQDVVIEPADLPEDQVQCHCCKSFAYLSQVTSPVSSKISCLDHSHIFGDSQKVLRCKYSSDELQAMLMRVNSRSIKAGRVVDMSGIEQRTSGRKRKPSAALLEAARAVLPLAQKIKLAHVSSNTNRERESNPDTPGHSYAESAPANDSSLDCDEDDKMEQDSMTSDVPLKSVSGLNDENMDCDGSAAGDRPLSSRPGFARTTLGMLAPTAAKFDSCPPSGNHQASKTAINVDRPISLGSPMPPSPLAGISTPHSTDLNTALDPASPTECTGDPKTIKRRRRSRKKSEVKTSDFGGKSSQHDQRDANTTPSSCISSHVHRLPVVAQIDVGGSASVVQLSPSREPLYSRNRGSSASQSQSEMRRGKMGKVSNTGTSKPSDPPQHNLSSAPQTSTEGRQGTNVIRLKSSSRAVSQPADMGKNVGQASNDNQNSTSKLKLDKQSPVVHHSTPHRPYSDHERSHLAQTTDEISKSSLQPLSIVSNRAPTTSSLLNILNPIASEPCSPFDHHHSPSHQHQSVESAHSGHQMYHNTAFSHSNHGSHLRNPSHSHDPAQSRSHSHAPPNSHISSQAFHMSYRTGPLSPTGAQIRTSGSQAHPVEISPSQPRPHLQHPAPIFQPGHSAYPSNRQMSPRPLHSTHRRFSSASYTSNSGDQDPPSHLIIHSSRPESRPQSNH